MLVIIAAAASAACNRGGGEEDDRDPEAFEVEIARDLVTVSSNANLFHAEERAAPEPDDDAIAAFESKIETWLNEHFTDLESGGEGGLAAVAAPGLLDGAAPAVVAGLTTDLASEQSPLREATYHFTTMHAGTPEWVRADVTVVGGDQGDTRGASFIFIPDDRGSPVLIMAEPHAVGRSGDVGGTGSEPVPSASESEASR